MPQYRVHATILTAQFGSGLTDFCSKNNNNVHILCLSTVKPGAKDCTFQGAGREGRHSPATFFSCHMYHIEEVERHLLRNFHKTIQRKSWSSVPSKLLACIRFLYKVVPKIGRLRNFNRAREIDFKFSIAWTIFMKLGTFVYHAQSDKACLRFFNFCLEAWL